MLSVYHPIVSVKEDDILDIVKVFGTNVRKYRTKLAVSQKSLQKCAGCIAHTSAILKGFNAVFHLITFRKLQTHLVLYPVSF